MVLETIYERTLEYNQNIDRNVKRGIGQYFTPPEIASFMANLSGVNRPNVRVLDAGAGTGMLGTAAVLHLLNQTNVTSIHLDLFENDENIISLLNRNMRLLEMSAADYNKIFTYNIYNENFIHYYDSNWNGTVEILEEDKYDLAIGNPPYKKIKKGDSESQIMAEIVHGQPNLYFLFTAMATSLLRNNGEIIYIVPRSFTSGLYFKNFREYLLRNVYFKNIHLFTNRRAVFPAEKILQELIIFKAIKNNNIDRNQLNVVVSNSGANLLEAEHFLVDHNVIVDLNTESLYIKIPENNEQLDILQMFSRWNSNLLSLGFQMKTGPVVEFRATEFLSEHPLENITVPLLWAAHIKKNRIFYPLEEYDKPQYFISHPESLNRLIVNDSYLIVKRLTSKEENRRIVVSIYQSELQFENIGIENHLNYIVKNNGHFLQTELYGLFVFFNSTYIDNYYRILNGSTQVNATEINSMPLPTLDIILQIGQRAVELGLDMLDSLLCDTLINEYINNEMLI